MLELSKKSRRKSVIGLGVSQALRPSLAPSTAFAPTPPPNLSTPQSPTENTNVYSPLVVSRRSRPTSTLISGRATNSSSGTAPFWRVSQQTFDASFQRMPSSLRSSSLALGSQHQHYLPPITDDNTPMPERVGSASSSRATGINNLGANPNGIHSTEAAGMWPPSRRTSSLFNRRGTVAFHSGMSGSAHDLGERTSSKLTLDEELYDLLFAYGEADIFGVSDLHGKDDEEEEDTNKPMTRQLLLDKIRQKKEVINKLRCQAWSMQRKRRTLRLAQKYLEQHESKVSKTHLYKEELRKRFRQFRRWFSNINTYFIPWESRIKKIESHFGSVVSSYFTFLRWLLYMNVMITLISFSFVIIPELIADATADAGRLNRTISRKQVPKEELKHADEIQRVWHYDGYLRYSPLFYGYYSNDEYVSSSVKYSVPLAYFIILLIIFCFSFFAILKKMASNAKMSKMGGGKAEQYVFNWKVFTGWDYSIGNPETASNNVMAAVIKLREACAESHVKKKEKTGWLKISLRILANIMIIAMIGFSIYCISFAFHSTATIETEGHLFSKNQVPSVMATITHVFPMIFDLIGRMESWHPRLALRLHLARVLVLYILNYCTFMYVLYEKYISHVYDLKVSATHEDNDDFFRIKRQLGGRNPNLERPPPFASRNFINRTQVIQFLNQTTKKIPGEIVTKKPNIISHTGQPVTIKSQFGPVGVNHATAHIKNATMNPLQRRFESRKLGPPPLPVFNPPPPRSRPRGGEIRRGQQFGPDWNTKSEEEDPNYVKRIPGGLHFGDVVKLPEEMSNKTSNNTEVELGESAKMTTQEYFNQNICWETMVGQEIVKLVTVDLYITIGSILVIDFLRGLWVKYCSSWWCWDIETTFPEYGEFKVAENVLHIVNNQGLIWLGFFFAPMLPAINNVKLIIIMYIRCWAVMTCNVPAREIFRASRSSNFYLWILLLWLVFCTVPVGIAIGSTRPSKVCGPFAGERYFYSAFIKVVEQRVDKRILNILRLLMNPGVIIPLLLFLGLIIYFLICLVRGLRRANTELQDQLTHERTEEKKKIFEMAGGGKPKKFAQVDRKEKKSTVKTGQYLPTVEQKRREPWRQYNGTDQNSSLCVTDEPDSSVLNSPSIGSPAPKSKISARGLEEMQITSPQAPKTSQFHPSLGSLDEVETSENPTTTSEYAKKDTTSKSMSINKTAPTERIDDWYNDGTRSDRSYDVQSAAVEMATPDEIRTLMKPLMDPSLYEKGPSAVSLAQFPPTSSPLTVVFGTSSSTVSRRSSKRDSYISLYDNPSPDEWFAAAAVQSAAITAGSVGLSPTSQQQPNFREMRTGSFSKAYWSVNSLNKLQFTHLTQPLQSRQRSQSRSRVKSPSPPKSTKVEPGIQTGSITVYSKEPRRIQPVPPPLNLKQTTLTKPTDLPLPRRQDSLKQSKTAEVPSFSDDFKPWPTIEEIKAQRGGLLPIKPPTPRSKSPPKMIRSEKEDREQASPTRFRISVSPTRRITSDSGSDTDTGSKKRKFVIKQRVLQGSSTSVASSKASATVSVPTSPQSNLLSPRAPRVEFGEDDSPRIQEPPPIPPHKK